METECLENGQITVNRKGLLQNSWHFKGIGIKVSSAPSFIFLSVELNERLTHFPSPPSPIPLKALFD